MGSAPRFIFDWLYARRNGGAMILRIDDTYIERNTEAPLNSISDTHHLRPHRVAIDR